jgi:exodeoxyribonuclease VII small subunit
MPPAGKRADFTPPGFDLKPLDRVFSRVSLSPDDMDQPIADMKFETALAELENIVQSMEGGKLELEASIAAYRRGMELMQHCQAQLTDTEEQIRILENGEVKTVDRSMKEPPLESL